MTHHVQRVYDINLTVDAVALSVLPVKELRDTQGHERFSFLIG